MKKYTLGLVLAAVLPMVAANGYEYDTNVNERYVTTRPAKTHSYKKTTTNRKTGGYNNTITNNFYYGQPAVVTRPVQTKSYATSSRYVSGKPAAAPVYVDVEEDTGYVAQNKRVSTVKKSYSSQERKYFLAHPFFQPLKGRFGSVTDLAYAKSDMKFDLLDATISDIDPNSPTYKNEHTFILKPLSGKAENTQFLVKEDVSFGLTDTLALILMAQYDKTKVTLKDLSDGSNSDSYSDSGLNLFGIGLQNRFVDNDKWIAMVAGYFQHQKDTANTLMAELKVGYKIDRTTVYGLGRIAYSDLIDDDSDIYGSYVEYGTGDYMMLSYKTDVKEIVYAEAGIGAFAVLNKYFTLNGELIYGHYDWHEQLNIKGAIGWQPGDMFALNLYASTSLYDSAKNKTKKYMQYENKPGLEDDIKDDLDNVVIDSTSNLLYTTGDYKIKNYNEWKIGVQAILYF